MASVNNVISVKEASEILKIAEVTIRKKAQKGEFDKKKYRKTKNGSYIFDKKYIESIS